MGMAIVLASVSFRSAETFDHLGVLVDSDFFSVGSQKSRLAAGDTGDGACGDLLIEALGAAYVGVALFVETERAMDFFGDAYALACGDWGGRG